MATYNLNRFSRPGTLKRVEWRLLRQFLSPYETYFAGRRVALPPGEDEDAVDYDALVEVLMTPEADTPEDLANALYYVHEMAIEEGMDQLLDEAESQGLALDGGSDVTPAEIAIQVWLHDPELLERKHAEQYLYRPRSFEYYQTDRDDCHLDEPDRTTLAALEQALDRWFEKKRRGHGCRVFAYPRSEETWFLVRHGDPFRREPSLQEGEPAVVLYRPEKSDVAVYHSALGELRINARSKGEKELYRAHFGLHLFGDEEFFPGQGKYTLEPLRRDGEACLACGDISGLERVTLREIQYFWGGPHNEVEIRKADDLFAALKARDRSIPDSVRLRSAKFEVKFEGAKRPRMVTVRPPKIAQFTRDSDSSLIEQWLDGRGFIRSRQTADAAA